MKNEREKRKTKPNKQLKKQQTNKQRRNKKPRLNPTEEYQNFTFCEKTGKLLPVTRCIKCFNSVKKGQQFCKKCVEELMEKEKKNIAKAARSKIKYQTKQNVNANAKVAPKKTVRDGEVAPKQTNQKKRRRTYIGEKRKTSLQAKKAKLAKLSESEKMVRKLKYADLHNTRCLSCNGMYVKVNERHCQKCLGKLKLEKTTPKTTDANYAFVDIKKLPEANEAQNHADTLEIIEIEDEEDAVQRKAKSSGHILNPEELPYNMEVQSSDYYVSIDDIKEMLKHDE